MTTTFQVIYLGNLNDIDTVEGNTVTEGADDIVGLEFGDAQTPLSGSVATWSQVGGADNTYDTNNDQDSDEFSINGGDPQTFDGMAFYNATITYTDGTTANITAAVAQDTNGETYLTPEFSENSDHEALEAKMIKSISLDAVAGNDYVGLISSRADMELVTCFTSGTRIRAEHGQVPIEYLAIGDRVRTLDHGLQTIRWIGSSTVQATGNLAPICFAPGSIGNTQTLRVSAQHRMMVDGGALELCSGVSQALIPACHLVNGHNITQQYSGQITYFHLMFDRHELIWAEGALTESFYPGEQGIGALNAEARDEIRAIFPDLTTQTHLANYGPLARVQIPKLVWNALQ